MMRLLQGLGAMAVMFGALSSPLLAASGHGGGGGHAASHASSHTSHTVAHTPAVVHSTVVHSPAVAHGSAVGHGSAAIHGGGGGVHPMFHGMHWGPGGYFHRDYRGWASWYWNAAYGCYWYWCADASCYYYWYAPGDCYLPVSQVAVYPPTTGIDYSNIVTPGMPQPMPVPQ